MTKPDNPKKLLTPVLGALIIAMALLVLPSAALAEKLNHFVACTGNLNRDSVVNRADIRRAHRVMAADRPVPRLSRMVDLNRDGSLDRRDAKIIGLLSGQCRSAADFNSDGKVDEEDLAMMLESFGQSSTEFDLSGSGVVEEEDINILLSYWGRLYRFSPCIADVNQDGKIDRKDLRLIRSLMGTNDTMADVNRDGVVDRTDLRLARLMIGTKTRCGRKVRNRIINEVMQEPLPEVDYLSLESVLNAL